MATIYQKGKVLAFLPKKASAIPFVTLYWQTMNNDVQKMEIIRISKAKFFASEFSTGYTQLMNYSSIPEMNSLVTTLMEVTSQDLARLRKTLGFQNDNQVVTETKL